MIEPVRIDDTIYAYSADVFRVCRRVTSSREDALDAYQETFLAFTRRQEQLDLTEDLRPWLRETARRCSLATLRKTARVGNQLASDVTDDSPETGVTFESSEVTAILHEEVSRLSPGERDVLVLLYSEGLSHREAAARLEIPEGSMHRRLSRTLTGLRNRLKKRDIVLSILLLLFLLHDSEVHAAPPSPDRATKPAKRPARTVKSTATLLLAISAIVGTTVATHHIISTPAFSQTQPGDAEETVPPFSADSPDAYYPSYESGITCGGGG